MPEKVDIKQVMSKAAKGDLVRIDWKKPQAWLEESVLQLEKDCGDIGLFDPDHLFNIEKELLNPDHKELKKRWDMAIKISTKVRLQLLRCKALMMLENFNDETKAPINTFCKTVLADVLVEGTERSKAKFAYLRNQNIGQPVPEDEIDLLEEGEE